MLDFKINTFLTLCETRSYTQTASKLNITQPAVTQHIQSLENSCNTKLFFFDRQRHLQLTEQGELLRAFASKAKSSSLRIMETLTAPPLEPDEIKIGTLVTTGESLVPHMAAEYLRKYPDKKVSMYLDEADSLLVQLHNNRIHFCITDLDDIPGEYESKKLFESETICVCSPVHPLAGQTVDFASLDNYRLIFRENDTYSKRNLTKILKDNHHDIHHFHSYVEIGTINAVKEMVMENIGISFIYRFVVQDDLDCGSLSQIHIHNFSSHHRFHLVWMKNSLFTPESLQFLHICREILTGGCSKTPVSAE